MNANEPTNERHFMSFIGEQCIAAGTIEKVITETKKQLTDRRGGRAPIFFEDATGQQIDFDLRGTPAEAVARLASHPLFEKKEDAKPAGPGRPKLGVISREVSLLPRHWEWLEGQRGGISVALRSLIEDAKKRGQHREHARKAREAAGKFMWTIAGDLPDFEEASRALYAKDHALLRSLTHEWPKDIRKHVQRLVDEAARLDELAVIEAAKEMKEMKEKTAAK